MREVVKIEGTPFTRRKKVSVITEGPDELRKGLQKLTQTLRDPWEQQRGLINWIGAALEQELEGKPPDHKWSFKPREDAGWYLLEMQIHAQIVDDHIAKGNASWAAQHGALFGELWSEFQLMLARGDIYCRAVEHRERRQDAGRRSIKPGQSHEQRAARVRHYLAKGDKLKHARENAAEDLGIAESTIRRSCRIVAKGAGGSG